MQGYNTTLELLAQTLYSDNVVKRKDITPEQEQQTVYLEASLASNVPSFPLSNPFVQASNYLDTVYLAIQHLMQAMSGAVPGLERKTDSKKGTIASSGGQYTDQGYEPFPDHPLNDILQHPNPADTFSQFVCQCILNWNLHGRLLIWARPNAVGAPIRYYCLPVPLMIPAFSVSNKQFPLGAWSLQQYYPGTGISGIMPTGLANNYGQIIDAREVYDLKNPHPLYRWAAFSPLVGADNAVDNIRNIDLSFWSIMSQGPKPAGIIDAPGADGDTIKQVQNKIDNAHGGARKHGRPIVLGGGDPDRPALKWTPLSSLVPDALHSEGWEIYTQFVLAIFGLDMAAVGLRRSGGHAERWAARKDEREGLKTFLNNLASLLTTGGLVKQWGLLKKGVRVTINLPEDVGYDPAEMSRDMAGDGTGTYNEVRRLRGLKGADGIMEEFGDLPTSLALRMAEKKLGIDQVTEQKQSAENDAKIQQQQTAQQSTQEQLDNPDNNRPHTPDEAKGSLGGEGAGAEKIVKAKDKLGHGSEKRGVKDYRQAASEKREAAEKLRQGAEITRKEIPSLADAIRKYWPDKVISDILDKTSSTSSGKSIDIQPLYAMLKSVSENHPLYPLVTKLYKTATEINISLEKAKNADDTADKYDDRAHTIKKKLYRASPEGQAKIQARRDKRERNETFINKIQEMSKTALEKIKPGGDKDIAAFRSALHWTYNVHEESEHLVKLQETAAKLTAKFRGLPHREEIYKIAKEIAEMTTKVLTKSFPDSLSSQENSLADVVRRVLEAPVLVNGDGHG